MHRIGYRVEIVVEQVPTRYPRYDEFNPVRRTSSTSAAAEARNAGDLLCGFYARGYLARLRAKVGSS